MIAYLLAVWLATSLFGPAPDSTSTQEPEFRVLVFSKTTAFRHESIPEGVKAINTLGRKHNFTVQATENSKIFEKAKLQKFDAVIFLSTSGNVLNPAQQTAFKRYIRDGGGFVGVHAAAVTEPDWPWYSRLVGAHFQNHPAIQKATIIVADRAHPSTRSLPVKWTRTDEWYNYTTNPRGNVHVLAALEEETYDGGEMGHDHPISWAHEYSGGRSWYTGLGHTVDSYSEALFLEHLLGGIRWAAGVEDGQVGATVEGAFEKVVLAEDVTNPMELAAAPDGRVFFNERSGAVKIWDPATRSTHMAGFIPVTTKNEDGMLGLTLDPNFETNHWIYLYYSPLGGEPRNQLSRFTVVNNRLDPESRVDILEVPVQQQECCHTGGSLAFGPEGNLYISTGDNTNPSASDLFTPIDERPGRAYWDAQRTAANTNDLRGKILRIKPTPDGNYEIPAGNMFPNGGEGRPEIYVMGLRNPYRLTVDPQTGCLYWGEEGPGAQAALDTRGPRGHDEFNRACSSGFYGWPYFLADNKPFRDYDFETKQSDDYFNPDAPVNESPNNTGLRELPPARPALIWYSYQPSELFPELEVGGMSAYAGPVYRYNAETAHEHAPPVYYDGSFFIYEWMRNWVKEVKFDEEGNVAEINPFQPQMSFTRPMDLDVGPHGRLYMLEWGTDFWGDNTDAQLVRLDYHETTERPPQAIAEANVTSGAVPLTVRFDGTDSYPRSGPEQLTYAWDFNDDGQIDAHTPTTSHTYESPGSQAARLTVVDGNGRTNQTEVAVTAGNTQPEVSIHWPVNGGIVDYNRPVTYEAAATDAEDNTIATERLTIQPLLQHGNHTHRQQPGTGPRGHFQVHPDATHQPYKDARIILEAQYTDAGTSDMPSVTATTQIVLQPRRKEAEHTTTREGADLETTGDVLNQVSSETFLLASDGDHVSYAPISLAGIRSVTFRTAALAKGTIELRANGASGSLIGKGAVYPPTSESKTEENDPETPSESWSHVTIPVSPREDLHELYLVFRGSTSETVVKIDWMEFNGPGVVNRRDGP